MLDPQGPLLSCLTHFNFEQMRHPGTVSVYGVTVEGVTVFFAHRRKDRSHPNANLSRQTYLISIKSIATVPPVSSSIAIQRSGIWREIRQDAKSLYSVYNQKEVTRTVIPDHPPDHPH